MVLPALGCQRSFRHSMKEAGEVSAQEGLKFLIRIRS
jgi:hypothetical protein